MWYDLESVVTLDDDVVKLSERVAGDYSAEEATLAKRFLSKYEIDTKTLTEA